MRCIALFLRMISIHCLRGISQKTPRRRRELILVRVRTPTKRLRSRRISGTEPPRAAEGALYGVGVWGASYLGLLPGAGLYPAATDESAGRNALMISAHLIWG